MAMKIVAGCGRGLILEAPPGMAVRPTAGRSREALFNSLGDLTGLVVWDLCAGSGALGLEAASRGAARVVMVEKERCHCTVIERNMAKLAKSGVAATMQIIVGDVGGGAFLTRAGDSPDMIFADPPYMDSIGIFEKLLGSPQFQRQTDGALLIWEIPDIVGAAGHFLQHPALESQLRKFGGTNFLLARIRNKQA